MDIGNPIAPQVPPVPQPPPAEPPPGTDQSSEAKPPSLAKLIVFELVIVSLIGLVVYSSHLFSKQSEPDVLSAESQTAGAEPTAIPEDEGTKMIEVTPTPTKKLEKTAYTIAVIGDSIVDTMGENLDYLKDALDKKYPDVKFKLYNYGRGSQNVEDGINELGTEFTYKDRKYPLLYETHPDVIIVGSFAYNPFSPYDRDRHWLGLTHLVQEVQKMAPNVYMLAEIAPLRGDFGRGPNGVNWDKNTAYIHSQHIIEQLENVLSLSKALNVPLINVYSPSFKTSAELSGTPAPTPKPDVTVAPEVNKDFVDTNDGIHPSKDGHRLIADEIVKTISLDPLPTPTPTPAKH